MNQAKFLSKVSEFLIKLRCEPNKFLASMTSGTFRGALVGYLLNEYEDIQSLNKDLDKFLTMDDDTLVKILSEMMGHDDE